MNVDQVKLKEHDGSKKDSKRKKSTSPHGRSRAKSVSVKRVPKKKHDKKCKKKKKKKKKDENIKKL